MKGSKEKHNSSKNKNFFLLYLLIIKNEFKSRITKYEFI